MSHAVGELCLQCIHSPRISTNKLLILCLFVLPNNFFNLVSASLKLLVLLFWVILTLLLLLINCLSAWVKLSVVMLSIVRSHKSKPQDVNSDASATRLVESLPFSSRKFYYVVVCSSHFNVLTLQQYFNGKSSIQYPLLVI